MARFSRAVFASGAMLVLGILAASTPVAAYQHVHAAEGLVCGALGPENCTYKGGICTDFGGIDCPDPRDPENWVHCDVQLVIPPTCI